MKIRPYDSLDSDSVAWLFTNAVRIGAAEHYDEVQRNAWAPASPDLLYWKRRLDPLTTRIAEIDGSIAGFIAFETSGHIEFLFTAPEHVRKGVASALCAHATAELIASGVSELSTEASLVARPFFERQGFEVIEEECVERRGSLLRRFRMRKALA
jgi:putative acetyltransferase